LIRPSLVAVAGREQPLGSVASPLPLATLVPGEGPWEVELGFGKGRYLLRRAVAEPGRRFLGVEMAARYFRILARRAGRRRLGNLLLLRGEALYLLAAVLPRRFAAAVHVYFPDPWPKSRHHKRRLFDPETVDLVLGLLAPGGSLLFATDHLDYGELVAEILGGYPGLGVRRLAGPWPDGPRTNYEAKYVEEGRQVVRLEVRLEEAFEAVPLHPGGRAGVLAAV
jgi:tRNA (guanine-N7-)-methyltransferase